MFNTSGSPMLRSETYDRVVPTGKVMTVSGTMGKVALLLLLVCITGSIGWRTVLADPARAMILMWTGIGGGLLLAIVTAVKKEWSPVTAPLYALVKGLFLGVISATYAAAFDGIVVQAITLTLAVAVTMLALYLLRLIRPTARFRAVVLAATGAIMLFYLVSLVLHFGFQIQVPMIHSAGPLGIGFSVVVVVLAALNLIVDFGLIEEGAARQAPAYMEWYAGFALLVTLIWLYIEILRLLSKLRGRD